MPSTMPRPPGVIGMTAAMLARPNATSRPSMSSVPPNAAQEHPQRRRVEQPVEARPQQDPPQQRAVGDQLLEPLADLAQRRGRRVRVEVQLAAEPAQEPSRPGPGRAAGRATSRATTTMMPRPARAAVTYSGLTPRSGIEISRAIQKMQVEHDGRAEAGRGQGEAGVGAADARQREQPVAERRAGRAAAGHDVAERLGAHLDAEHPQPGDLRRPASPSAERVSSE